MRTALERLSKTDRCPLWLSQTYRLLKDGMQWCRMSRSQSLVRRSVISSVPVRRSPAISTWWTHGDESRRLYAGKLRRTLGRRMVHFEPDRRQEGLLSGGVHPLAASKWPSRRSTELLCPQAEDWRPIRAGSLTGRSSATATRQMKKAGQG